MRGASWTGRHFPRLFQLLSLSRARRPAEGSAKPQEDATLVSKVWLWPPAPGDWVWPMAELGTGFQPWGQPPNSLVLFTPILLICPARHTQAWECWAELYRVMFSFGAVVRAQVSCLFSAYAPWVPELWVSASPVLKLQTFHTTWSLNVSQPP